MKQEKNMNDLKFKFYPIKILFTQHTHFNYYYYYSTFNRSHFNDIQITAKTDIVMQSMSMHHIPILISFGETSEGQMVPLKSWDVTASIAKALLPLKVLCVNSHGGFLDEDGKVREGI